MEEYIIPDNDGKGFTIGFIGEDVEFVNPIDYYSDCEIRRIMSLERMMLNMKNPIRTSSLSNEFFYKRAAQEWEERCQDIIKTEVPSNFISLLTSDSRKEQIRLLKGQSLTPYQLAAFIFKAWSDYRFTFSNYIGEHIHKGLDKEALPEFFSVQDDKVRVSGNTTLSDGQLKQVIEQRKVTISKFLDNEDSWHCLFLTYKSLRGEEGWKDGQPHLHYISDKWNIKRADAVAQLKSEKYPGTPVHIDLLDYNRKNTSSGKSI